ncbi:MAG: glycosyltransferase family 4 protein [Ferruginibacter sp.]
MKQKIDNRISVLEIIGSATQGGMENQILSFLKNISLDEFSICCICPCESRFTRTLRELGLPVFVTPLADDPQWRSIQTTLEVCRLHNVDVIHAHMPKSHVLAAIAGSLAHKPVVATIHGMHLTTHELGVALACKSYLIANCSETYIQALSLGIPNDRVRFLPNGVDTTIFNPEKDGLNFRNSIGVSPTTPLVGFIGRLEYEKGPDLFMSAAAYIHERDANVHFVVVGAGSMNNELKASCLKYRFGEHLHFVDWSIDLPEIYPAFDIIAQTSRSDGTSLVVLEAMASGTPVIGMSVGGVRDIIENEHTGVLVNEGDWEQLGNQILKLLKTPLLLKAMGSASRERVEQYFNIAQNASDTASILQYVARSGKGQHNNFSQNHFASEEFRMK